MSDERIERIRETLEIDRDNSPGLMETEALEDLASIEAELAEQYDWKKKNWELANRYLRERNQARKELDEARELLEAVTAVAASIPNWREACDAFLQRTAPNQEDE